jgi:hypothetical protein
MGELFQGHWWMGWKAKLEPQRLEEDSMSGKRVDGDKMMSDSRVERV